MIDITDEEAGAFWPTLARARPGERIVYDRGAICTSVHRTDAMAASEGNLVHLVQKRIGPFRYVYIAQKRSVVGARTSGGRG